MNLDQLAQIMTLMRAHGCVQLRDGETAIVLGPAPVASHGTSAREVDPDVTAMGDADQQAVADYNEHLYGKRA